MNLAAPTLAIAAVACLGSRVSAQIPPGEEPALGFDRITQDDVTGGSLSLDDIRRRGLGIFTTPFNKLDGFGEGPGIRPTLGNNGSFLRVNGLDSQSCTECHFIGSNRVRPPRFAVGGVGGASANVFFGPTEIDVDDSLGNGFAFFDGRNSNPLFLFGVGGVELVAKEMTAELQALKARARQRPGTGIALVAKGVSFGTIAYIPGVGFDTSNVEGIDPDLVVRPFSRKGDFATVRQLTISAMSFHHGMQPAELLPPGFDGDNDGFVDEILVGEMSALHVFAASLERPVVRGEETPGIADASVKRGFRLFLEAGCGECHVPALETSSSILPLVFPVEDEEPFANAYYDIDLAAGTAGFELNARGGVTVRMFSDLKRHHMGTELAETTGDPDRDPFFITAKLWGVADTPPYLHEGRALTLTDAIELHGGEGAAAATNFSSLPPNERVQLLSFLRTLRTPVDPSADLR